ncbi:DUF222 domain-containing protein [Georgenia sp. 10Sc9-8]|uniref:DUF222 domain-containing protein n=1 Tax=Georgenia halotolerans TaxID=3028317 RepID=A0ABT5U0F6_9MICO|nr:DUF222 domain-containing protein [Georgenia halotolerans]
MRRRREAAALEPPCGPVEPAQHLAHAPGPEGAEYLEDVRDLADTQHLTEGQHLEQLARAAETAAWEQACLSDADVRALEAGLDDPEPPADGGGHMPAEVLRELDPGAFLAAVVEDAELGEVPDQVLVEVVAAGKRLEAWAAARAAQAAAALARRPSMNPVWAAAGEYQALNVAGEELALRLGVTRAEARQLVDVGDRALGSGVLAPTGEALVAGRLSWRKACTIVQALAVHPDPVAWSVQDEVLDAAPLRTPNQLVRDLSAALIAVDPEEADSRHRRAARHRHVSRPRPLPDGMAQVNAVLPADDAVAVDIALHAAARAAKSAGDGRTVDQLRADALATMATTALATGSIGATGGTDGAACAGPVLVGPGGPAVGAMPNLRRRPSMALTTPATGRTEIRVTVPLSVLAPPETGCSTVRPSRPRCGGAPPARSRPAAASGHERQVAGDPPDRPGDPPDGAGDLPDSPGGPPDRAGDPPDSPGALPTGSAPAPALDSPAAEVAHLDGYGPVPPQLARTLAMGGVWRRLVTDPVSDALLDVGRRRYRPPAELARHVRMRDGTCVRPGCTTPAAQCDIDHTVPWAAGGETSATNLGALCFRDHRVKSSGAFTVTQVAPGVFEWTTAAGLRYRRNIDGTTQHLDRAQAGPPPY